MAVIVATFRLSQVAAIQRELPKSAPNQSSVKPWGGKVRYSVSENAIGRMTTIGASTKASTA